MLDAHGRVHGLVNAAGGQFPAQLKHLSLNGWNAVLNNAFFAHASELEDDRFGGLRTIGANNQGQTMIKS